MKICRECGFIKSDNYDLCCGELLDEFETYEVER